MDLRSIGWAISEIIRRNWHALGQCTLVVLNKKSRLWKNSVSNSGSQWKPWYIILCRLLGIVILTAIISFNSKIVELGRIWTSLDWPSRVLTRIVISLSNDILEKFKKLTKFEFDNYMWIFRPLEEGVGDIRRFLNFFRRSASKVCGAWCERILGTLNSLNFLTINFNNTSNFCRDFA
jgi:hypothetical protein